MTEGIAADRLRSFIERIERLEVEIKELNADKSEVYSEAKATGFDVKIMKKCIQLRRMESADLREHEELIALYMGALGSGTTVALTRVRAHAVEPHDPKTGEVHTPAPQPAPTDNADLTGGLDWAAGAGLHTKVAAE